MPALEEIAVEMRKLGVDSTDQEAEQLHDVWLSNGFRLKGAPIRDWKAALRNWVRWRENGGADIFG